MNVQMRSAAIATCIEYFNIILIIALAAFASWGIIAVLSKKLRGRLPLLSAFGIAALAAFALEATAFNLLHYLKYFSGPPTEVAGMSETNPNSLIMTDSTQAMFSNGEIVFRNLNRKVTSVFVDMEFNDMEVCSAHIIWSDEQTTQTYLRRFYKYLPHENYIPIQPCGKVSDISVAFVRADSSVDVTFNRFAINEPIPFYFSGLRLLAVSLLLFVPLALANKKLRAKAAFYLFEYKFDPKNKKQSAVYACAVALLLLFSWVCVYTSVSDEHEGDTRFAQYNRCLVDAFIAGRTYLDYRSPEKLLKAERPYDFAWRRANGFAEINKESLDFAWYRGKYYCYFGVVPAALLYIPYKLVTGKYLSNQAGVFLFCAIAVILLAVLWRYLVKKYMPDIRYALYLLSFLTLFFASGLSINLRWPVFYCIVQSAAFMFTVAGVLLLLKSVDNEKINHLKLFFACLCLALVFGCRPNMGLASLLVPVVLWKRKTWKSAALAALPYVIVAIPLCLYNYARFESIFEFGANYNLTGQNIKAFGQQNVISKIFAMSVSSARYLFSPNQFSLSFPFVKVLPGGRLAGLNAVDSGVLISVQDVLGMVNFPIVFLLFYMLKNIFNKNKPKTFYALSASLIIAAVIIVLFPLVAGIAARYVLDFATLIIVPSLFCAYYWCRDGLSGDNKNGAASTPLARTRLSIAYGLMAASIFVGLFLFVHVTHSYSNPTLYRYLETSLGVFGNV